MPARSLAFALAILACLGASTSMAQCGCGSPAAVAPSYTAAVAPSYAAPIAPSFGVSSLPTVVSYTPVPYASYYVPAAPTITYYPSTLAPSFLPVMAPRSSDWVAPRWIAR